MLTEYQALFDAKFYTGLAMTKLKQFSGDSYCADEAHEALDQALQRLEGGLRYFGTEGETTERSEPPGVSNETQGEGEGLPDPPSNARTDDWSGTWSKARYVDVPQW